MPDENTMPCGCPHRSEYPYFNPQTGHVHCIRCGAAYYHQTQIDANAARTLAPTGKSKAANL